VQSHIQIPPPPTLPFFSLSSSDAFNGWVELSRSSPSPKHQKGGDQSSIVRPTLFWSLNSLLSAYVCRVIFSLWIVFLILIPCSIEISISTSIYLGFDAATLFLLISCFYEASPLENAVFCFYFRDFLSLFVFSPCRSSFFRKYAVDFWRSSRVLVCWKSNPIVYSKFDFDVDLVLDLMLYCCISYRSPCFSISSRFVRLLRLSLSFIFCLFFQVSSASSLFCSKTFH